jgi:hypothetical protein
MLQVSPRRAYGEVMMISGPPVVARVGRAALGISASGLLLSSEYQNAASVAITITQVRPRSRRKLAARTSTSISPPDCRRR